MLCASFAALICPRGSRIAALQIRRARGISGEAGRRVSRAGADDRLRAEYDGLRDRRRHTRVFERAGRIASLMFQPQTSPARNIRAQRGRIIKRRVALEERHERGGVIKREAVRDNATRR